jgi:hypothetical protein
MFHPESLQRPNGNYSKPTLKRLRLTRSRLAPLPTPPHTDPLSCRLYPAQYENVVRSRAVQDARELMYEAAATEASPEAKQQLHDKCSAWASEFTVRPGVSWGTLPEALRRNWMTLRCHENLPAPLPAAAAVPFPEVHQPPVRRAAITPASTKYPSAAVFMAGQPLPPEASSLAPTDKSVKSAALSLLPRTGDWATGDAQAPPEARELTSTSTPRGFTGRSRGFTFWSSDFHISPIADLKDLFKPLGMHIVDKSLSGHCHLKKTCQTDLRVLTKNNGISLGKCPNALRRDFFRAYYQDPQMRKIDAFLCHHACGLCEVFMPFNKSLVVVASTRFEIGRHEPERWRAWNANLRAIASNPRNIVAANNRCAYAQEHERARAHQSVAQVRCGVYYIFYRDQSEWCL